MLFDEVVFSIDADGFRWRDVIVAAVRWGEWSSIEQRTRQGFAAVRHAETSGEALPAGKLDTASREFRYSRDLVTALSMEQWLTKRGVSPKDWTGYLKRELNRARWPNRLDALVAEHPLADDAAARLTLDDAKFSDDITRWAKTLAARAAAVAGMPRSQPATTPLEFPEAVRALLGDDPATVGASANRIQEIDHAFEQFRASQITEPVLSDYVANRQLEWMRFECRLMAMPQEDAAAEAALLMREDGERFTMAYQAAHVLPKATQFFYDQLDGTLRDQFLAARPGDLVGPARVNDEYVLYLIEEKSVPTVRDPEVRRRAEEGVLAHALSQQLDRRVRWHVSA
jgi:hypothetical protein